MEYVNLGSSGLRVSRIALGMGLREQHDPAQAERLIHRALDHGINFFDCANIYGLGDDRANAGVSEEILGRALRHVRDDVVITSKVASQIGPGPNDRGGSRYAIMREIERSLQRLNTDRIDIYLLHVFDNTTPLEEQLRALDDLVSQGKIRYVGVCNYQAWQVCQAMAVQDRIQASSLITIQNPYNLLNRDLEREMFPFVRFAGLGVMAYGPLAVGLLSGQYKRGERPPDSLWARKRPEQLEAALTGQPGKVIDTVHSIAKRTGMTVAQVALQWVMSHPEISTVITGADTAEQLDDNLGAVGLPLSDDDRELLDSVSAGIHLEEW